MQRFKRFLVESEISSQGKSPEEVERQLYAAWKIVFDIDDSDFIKEWSDSMGSKGGVEADFRIYNGASEHFRFSIRFYYPLKDSWYIADGNLLEWSEESTPEDMATWGTSQGNSEHRLDTNLPHYNDAKINLNNACTFYVTVMQCYSKDEDWGPPVGTIKDVDLVGGLINIPRVVKRIIDDEGDKKERSRPAPTSPNKKPQPVGAY